MRAHTNVLIISALGLLAVGCSESSSRPWAAAPATAPAATTAGAGSGSLGTPVGSLLRKAIEFEVVMQRQHVPFGLVQDVRVAGGQVQRLGNAPSRALWTGFYAASQAMRYRATRNPDALASMEKALWALHDLHEITGVPGVIARGYDDPAIETHGWPGSGRLSAYHYNKGSPSRDQYSGWFYGVSHAFPHVRDPALRQALRADVSAILDRLMAGNLQMQAPWGPQGTVEEFFNLNPDYFYQNQITPQSWATVDDFPFNLITKSVPYSPQLAAAIANAKIPPVRAGEALRAVFMFTVGAQVTGDPRYAAYKDRLLHQRGFTDVFDKYLTIIDDLLHGTNLAVVEDTLKQLFVALGDILQAYLVAQGQSQLITQVLIPLLAGPLANWLADAAVDVIAWIHDPANATKLQRFMQFAQTLTQVLSLVGLNTLAGQINGYIQSYGVNLNHQGLIDLSNTVRSHLGVELTLMPLARLTELETDPGTVALYRRLIGRYCSYLTDDHNPMVDLIHLGYGTQPRATDRPHSVEALTQFPTDMTLRKVDNSNWPGLVISPWPDRMGKTGHIALRPTYFPPHERGRHIFLWNEHPRAIVSGHDAPDVKIAPLGYLMPYWLARDLRVIGPGD